MKLVYPVSGLLLLALHAAGEKSMGTRLITKRLSKKALSPIVYNLRGTAAPIAPHDAEPVDEDEFDRMVVILEAQKGGPKLSSKAPVTETLNQQGTRFQPDLIVVPVGSTVEFPNCDPVFLPTSGTIRKAKAGR